MFIPFSNWQPDVDPVTPNFLVDPTNNVVPTIRGYRNAVDLLALPGAGSLSAAPVSMWYAMRADGSNNMYGASASQIYIRTGATWAVAVAATATISAVSRWQFAQWGNLTFAGALETQPLVTDTTTFTCVGLTPSFMPRFAIIDSVNEFLMIGNISVSITYSDGFGATMVTPGDYADRWWCSGVGNPLTWQPDTATQAASNRLTDMPGPFTAGRGLADRFVFYKKRGIWVGQYVGPPFIWEWSLISKEVGTHGQQCIVVVAEQHYFVGNDDFYIFDGQQTRSIGTGVREWFFDHVDKTNLSKIWGVADRYNKLIYWWYPASGGDGTLTEFVVYHYQTGKWGRGTQTMVCAAEFLTDSMTWDQLWTAYTFDTVPNTTYDDAVYTADSFIPIFFRTSDRRMATLNGPASESTLVTTFGGDDTKASLLRRVRARWMTAPTSATLTPYRLMRQGENPGAGTAVTMYDARWDFTQNARWHKVKIQTVGNWETSGIDAEVVIRGRE